MSKAFSLRVSVQCFAAGLLLLTASAPQAGIFDGVSSLFKDNSARTADWLTHPDKRLTWGAYEYDYLQLVPRESNGSANQQPVTLSEAQVRATLMRITVQDGKTTVPLLGDVELDRLAPAISAVLAKAGPDQELIFEISGPHSFFSIFTKKYTDSGRMFFANGQLNVIFGAIQRQEEVNPRTNGLNGLPVGTRQKASADVTLATPAAEAGQLKRPDWIALNVTDAPAPAVASNVAAAGSRVAAPVVAAQPAPHGLDSAEETRMNKLETRLVLLRHLHEQGLLTDAEFEAKRVEIVKQM